MTIADPEMEFSEAIFLARKKLGLNQTEMAQRIGVSRVTIWHWEHRTQLPVQLYCRQQLRELFSKLNMDYTLPVKR